MADSKYKVIKSKLYNYMKSIENGLNILNFGNISYFDENNNIVIKPSELNLKLTGKDFIIYNSKKEGFS